MNKDKDIKKNIDEKRPYRHFTTKFPIPEKFKVTAISIEQFQTAVTLRKEWKDSTKRPRSQGFIMSANLLTAQVELIPAFNKNDGSTREDWETCTYIDKDGKPVARYLVSLLERGQMNGDLHTRSISRVGWGDVAGAKGGVIAGAIWIDEFGNVSAVMNRSSSQNFFSITWDDEFIDFFRVMTSNHPAHALSIKRELPRAIFQQLINDIFVDVGLSPLGDLLTSKIIPDGPEGIKSHLQLESEWEQNKPRCQVMLVEALLADEWIDEKASTEDAALLIKNNRFTLAKLEKQPEYKKISYNLQLIISIKDKEPEKFAELTTKNPELIANVSLSDDGSTALMYAAFMGDYDKLMSLIKLIQQYHPDQLAEFLDAPNVNGVTALMMAGVGHQIDCVKALCWAGARLDCLNDENQDIFALLAPVSETALYHFLEAFSLYSSSHRTELEEALQNRLDAEEFAELLEKGLVSNISLADAKGNNLLMLAVELDAEVEVIEDIISHFQAQSSKKEFNEFMYATNHQGLNVWQIALRKRDIKVFKILQKYFDNNHDNDSKESGLIYNLKLINSIGYTTHLEDESFESLIKTPQQIANVADKDGWTALMYAAANGDLEKLAFLIGLLKKYRPDQLEEFLNARNNDGETALILATKMGHIDCIKVLCTEGAKLEIATDSDNLTAFSLAVRDDDINTMKYLLNLMPPLSLRKAIKFAMIDDEYPGSLISLLKVSSEENIHLPDAKGNTLLINAIRADADLIKIELLIKAIRAQTNDKEFSNFLNAKNHREESALGLALDRSNTNAIKLLKKYGARLNKKDQQDEEKSHAIILIEGFAKFLQNNFLEAKQQNSIAKVCRMKLLGYVLPILQTSTLFEIQLIRKIVSAYSFMHHQPSIARDGMFIEQDGLPSISAKYPTKSEEGQLIKDSKPPQYGTCHSTACFYQLCRELRGDRVLTTKATQLLTELQETYPSLKFSADNRLIAENKNIFAAQDKLSTIQVLKAKLLWSKMVGEKISDSEISEIVTQGEQMLMEIKKDGVPAENKLKLIQDLGDTVMEYATHASKINSTPINASLKKLELQCQLLYTDVAKQLSPSLNSRTFGA